MGMNSQGVTGTGNKSPETSSMYLGKRLISQSTLTTILIPSLNTVTECTCAPEKQVSFLIPCTCFPSFLFRFHFREFLPNSGMPSRSYFIQTRGLITLLLLCEAFPTVTLDSLLASWLLSSLPCYKESITVTAAWETHSRCCLFYPFYPSLVQLLWVAAVLRVTCFTRVRATASAV